jgi:hypothetical protein
MLLRDYVSTFEVDGKEVLKVEPEALQLLSRVAMDDVGHLLRPGLCNPIFVLVLSFCRSFGSTKEYFG